MIVQVSKENFDEDIVNCGLLLEQYFKEYEQAAIHPDYQVMMPMLMFKPIKLNMGKGKIRDLAIRYVVYTVGETGECNRYIHKHREIDKETFRSDLSSRIFNGYIGESKDVMLRDAIEAVEALFDKKVSYHYSDIEGSISFNIVREVLTDDKVTAVATVHFLIEE